MRYSFISDHASEFTVLSICRVLKVSRPGYYAWMVRKEGELSELT
jgi:hypothetical protein